MIILRVIRGIRQHFPARAMEWQLAVLSIAIGWRLSRPDEMIATMPALSGMSNIIASEQKWATMMILIGGLRLIALIVNGTFAGTFYGRISPHVRFVMAFFSCFAWLTFSLGLAQSPVGGFGFIVFPVFLASDMYNAARAAGDAGQVDGARKNEPI